MIRNLMPTPTTIGTGRSHGDLNNGRMTGTIVAPITTTTHRSNEPTQLFIEVATPEGRQTGLLKDSIVSCENLATVEQSLVQRTIGSLAPGVVAQVNDCLKVSLELPPYASSNSALISAIVW